MLVSTKQIIRCEIYLTKINLILIVKFSKLNKKKPVINVEIN